MPMQKNCALDISTMPFQNGIVLQTLIVAASLVVAKSVFNQSDLLNDIQTVLKVSVEWVFYTCSFTYECAVTEQSLWVDAGLGTSWAFLMALHLIFKKARISKSVYKNAMLATLHKTTIVR